MCARYGLPAPEINHVLAGREVDAYFPAQRLIVELDGYAFHSDRRAFERDRVSDALALAQGIATVRLTGERLEQRPEPEAERLRTILAQRTP